MSPNGVYGLYFDGHLKVFAHDANGNQVWMTITMHQYKYQHKISYATGSKLNRRIYLYSEGQLYTRVSIRLSKDFLLLLFGHWISVHRFSRPFGWTVRPVQQPTSTFKLTATAALTASATSRKTLTVPATRVPPPCSWLTLASWSYTTLTTTSSGSLCLLSAARPRTSFLPHAASLPRTRAVRFSATTPSWLIVKVYHKMRQITQTQWPLLYILY